MQRFEGDLAAPGACQPLAERLRRIVTRATDRSRKDPAALDRQSERCDRPSR